MPNEFDLQVIEEFRANAGVVGAYGRLLLLTTTGARTGAPHTTPLGYLPDGDRTLVLASAGGSPRHPDWYRNVLAQPRVTVETGVFTYEADAAVLDGAERDRLFDRAVEADPGWLTYQEKSGRTIPVVALHPVRYERGGGAWGDGLRTVHAAFRRELALVRAEVAAAGPRLGAQLRINCLTLCRGLEHHHRTEDDGMFPYLDAHRPDLADTVARLRAEHDTVHRLLDELRATLADDTTDQPAVLAEVDRLVAEVTAHLDREEAELVAVLNAAAP